MAFGGSVHLVVWQGGLAVRVDRSGAVLDASPFRIPAGNDISVAFDGENFLVVSQFYDENVGAVRVSPSGAVLDTAPIAVSVDDAVGRRCPSAAPTTSWRGSRRAQRASEPDGTVVDRRVSVPAGLAGSTSR